MHVAPPIRDHATYNAEMAKSLPDKLFFLDKVEASIWVDFGCGDGSLLRAIRERYPVSILWGIEADPLQASRAQGKGNWVVPTFRDYLQLHQLTGKSAAIFSSVLHESPELIQEAIDFGFDYIVIRDMALLGEWRDKERDLSAAFKLPYWGTPSWEREVSEDYFQLSASRLLFAERGYKTIYFEHYAVPAIQDRIENDLGVRPEVPTHVKAIWKRV